MFSKCSYLGDCLGHFRVGETKFGIDEKMKMHSSYEMFFFTES